MHARPGAPGRADRTRPRALPTIPMDELYVLPGGRRPLRPRSRRHARRRGEAPRREPGRGVPPAGRRARRRRPRQLAVPQRRPRRGRDDAAPPATRSWGWPTPARTSGMIMDSSQPTFFLTYWIRDRGLVGHRRGDPAAHVRHRGAVRRHRPRRAAARARSRTSTSSTSTACACPQPEYVHDFPRGAGRYVQRATGYDRDDRQRRGVHGGRRAHRRARRSPPALVVRAQARGRAANVTLGRRRSRAPDQVRPVLQRRVRASAAEPRSSARRSGDPGSSPTTTRVGPG